MYKKCIILTVSLALVAFAGAQVKDATRPINQNSTKCYTCDSPATCRSPSTVICDQKSANVTRSVLAKHFSNVVNITNSAFECMEISYSIKNSVVLAVSGCVNVGLNPCKLQPKNATYTAYVCRNCTKNLCNPAGTFSSSITIMMSAVLGLLLLKYLYI